MALVAPRITSPSTMRVNSPYRSAMCSGCHGVTSRRSARAGTASSAATRTTTAGHSSASGSSSRSSHSAWTAVTSTAYRSAGSRNSGADAAARSHWPTIASRMTT